MAHAHSPGLGARPARGGPLPAPARPPSVDTERGRSRAPGPPKRPRAGERTRQESRLPAESALHCGTPLTTGDEGGRRRGCLAESTRRAGLEPPRSSAVPQKQRRKYQCSPAAITLMAPAAAALYNRRAAHVTHRARARHLGAPPPVTHSGPPGWASRKSPTPALIGPSRARGHAPLGS